MIYNKFGFVIFHNLWIEGSNDIVTINPEILRIVSRFILHKVLQHSLLNVVV